MHKADLDEIVAAFKSLGWNKPLELYETYLKEQTAGLRSVIIAKQNEAFCGYVTLKWKSDYPSFAEKNIPEIADLNVLPPCRRQGIGTKLISACEDLAKERDYTQIGLGVGLSADYGNAQQLYVQLGFRPDGQGLQYKCQALKYGDQAILDDELLLFFSKAISSDGLIGVELPTQIETPRLILRPPQVNEGKLLNTAVLESFELLHQYMLWAKEKPSLEESEAVVKREAKNWVLKRKSDPELLLFIVDKTTHDLIGATGFHAIDWDVPCAETGYWIRKQYAGHGYMTEAVNALTQYAFKVLKLKRLGITCDVGNERSKKIPERLGYHLESRMKANRIKPDTGEVSDTFMYVRHDLINLPELEINWK